MPYIGQLPATGENNAFRILDDISSYVLTFDGSDASVVSTSNDTITITGAENRFLTGQRVTYSKGSGGTVITGLTDDTAYYVIRDSNTTIKLATSSSNATNGVAVDLTGVGGGTAHKITLAFDGTNTKFRTTYDSGKQDPKVTRAAQLVLSINGIIQQPIDSTSPSSGFGIDGGDIVFSTAPDANDDFWGHVLASNTVTFDISDNDIDNFTGDASTVNFTLSKTPSDNRNVLVTLDGVVQYPSDNSTTRAYQVSENELQFVSAPALNVSIQVRHIGFAGASSGSSASGGVTGFYGRTGNVVLKNTDNPVIGNLTAVDGTFSGNVSIAKTLTYMDVEHIDAVGVVTAQSGIQCLDDLNVGLGTFFVDKSTGKVGIGTNIPATRLHLRDGDSASPNLITLQASTARNNYIGINAADNLVIAADEDDEGGDSSIRFRIDGDEKVRFKGDKVGIGTVTPSQLLHLQANAAHQILLKRDGGSPSEVAFKNSGNYAVISNNTNGIDLQTGTTPSSSVHIDQNGKVGITTEEPQRNLHIHQNTAASAYLHMTNSTTGATTTDGFSLYIATSGIAYYRARETTGQHVFYTGTTEKFRIDEDGKVGILSTSPGKTLDIIGSLQVKDTGNKIGLLVDPSNGDFQVNQSVASWTNPGVDPVALLKWGWTGATGNYMYMGSGGNDAVASQMALLISGEDGFKVGRSAWDGTNGDISATNEFFTVSKTGSVGIGTSVPAGRLEVIDTSALGIISRSATTQATDTNRALKVRNNSTTDTFSVSYKGEGYFAGRVGIGTDDPTTDIHIWDDAPNIRLTDTNPYVANRYGQIAQSGGVLQLSSRGDGSEHGGIYFYNVNNSETLNAYRILDNYHSWYTAADSNSTKMRLTDAGGLGIGTITPDHLLHVHKGGGDAVVTIESTGNGNHAALEFRRTSSGGDGKGAGSIYVTGDTSATEARMHFGVGHNINHGTDTRMVIMGNGEVGIGTDDAITQLHLKGSDPTFRIQRYDQSAYADITADTSGKIVFKSDPGAHASSDGFQFTVNNDEKLMINSSGQVGINQSVWDDKDHMLEVVNDTHNVEIARFTSSSGGSGSVRGEGSIGLSLFNTTTYPHVSIGVEEAGNASFAGHLTFATRSVGSDSKPVEKMRIKSSGEVGIGTTTPSGTLHLSGTGPVLTCTADNGSSGLRVNTVNQTTGQVFRVQQDSTTKFEVAWDGHTTITNGFSFGPHHGHTNDENVKMHLYSDDNINDAVNFSVAIEFGNANNGPFMIELYQAHGHYTGNASYCKILGSYGAHDANGGCSFLVLEKQGYIDTGSVFAVTDNSTSTQRTNNTSYTVTITGKSASSNTGTSLKVKTYVIVYSRTGPASVVFAEV